LGCVLDHNGSSFRREAIHRIEVNGTAVQVNGDNCRHTLTQRRLKLCKVWSEGLRVHVVQEDAHTGALDGGGNAIAREGRDRDGGAGSFLEHADEGRRQRSGAAVGQQNRPWSVSLVQESDHSLLGQGRCAITGDSGPRAGKNCRNGQRRANGNLVPPDAHKSRGGL